MAQRFENTKRLLAFFAHKILNKYQPLVIGVTGSVGKTSTRHAIASVLSKKYNVREPIKNYNNELGILLTVFGTEGWEKQHKILAWIRILSKALGVWVLPYKYPEILVLEYGIDHPEDMDDLLKIVKPKIAIVTNIGFSHIEHFGSQQLIAKEKGKLVESLPSDGTFIYNLDDPLVVQMTERTRAGLISYSGSSQNADFYLVSEQEKLEVPFSTHLKIKNSHQDKELEITIPVIGKGHSMAALVAVAVSEVLQVEKGFLQAGLQNYKPILGRLNILPGIKNSILIDDTYNASPGSMIEAVKLLARFAGQKKIAILGDMLELGDQSDSAHKEIGQLVSQLPIQKLIGVGDMGKIITDSALSNGMSEQNVSWYANSDIAQNSISQDIENESIILVKGSQGARMEKISKQLLKDSSTAAQVLPRQYGKWLNT